MLTQLDHLQLVDQQHGHVVLLRQRADAVVLQADDGVLVVEGGGQQLAIIPAGGSALLGDDAVLKERPTVVDHRSEAAIAHRLRAEDLHHRRQRAVLRLEDGVEGAHAEGSWCWVARHNDEH